MSFYREERVACTRRARRCNWCSQRIDKGSPSVVTVGTYDGSFNRARYHPECAAAVTRYCKVNQSWYEEMPDGPMNRGGIEEAGEPEQDTEEKE